MNASVWMRDIIYGHASVYEKWYTYNFILYKLAYTSNECIWIFYNTIDDNEGREWTMILNINNDHKPGESREIGRET